MYKVFISIHGELICCLILKVFDEIREPKVLHFLLLHKDGQRKNTVFTIYTFSFFLSIIWLHISLSLVLAELTTYTCAATRSLRVTTASPLGFALGLTSRLFAAKAEYRNLLRDGCTVAERSVDYSSPIHCSCSGLMKKTIVFNSTRRAWDL